MTTGPGLIEAASGHLMLEFGDLAESDWQRVVELLEKDHGFSRAGRRVIAASEMIHQDLVCEEFTLSAGWDNWSGHYLLAKSPEGDRFLQQLFERLKSNRSLRRTDH